jgi:hypothetical protein
MPFTVIEGTFHVVGYSPDGDSIRFQPDDASLIRQLAGPPARFNQRGHVQLRIEAIDTLETHFSPPSGGGVFHQPVPLAHAATDRLLAFVGITAVKWDVNHISVMSAHDGVRGHILTRAVERNGRPIAFVFAGEPTEPNGTSVILDVARLQHSYNLAALSEGLAYPTYYQGLFHDLRDALTAVVVQARKHHRGVHAQDKTTVGFAVPSIEALSEELIILPKLFRRLCEYLVEIGSVAGFKAALAKARERVLDLRLNNFTHWDAFIQQTSGGDTVTLTRRPEELVFDEGLTHPPNAFSAVLDAEDG